jgi:hypothetical protein
MYIGVTGFTDRDQVRHALTCIPTNPERQLMVGVLASHKTIVVGARADNPMRYPRREDIADIFPSDWRALNLVHYTTHDQAHLYDQLMQVLEWGGPACNGLQLNMVWPAPETLARLRRAQPKGVIVLLISGAAIAQCQFSAERVAVRALGYDGLVDYILVDHSGGTNTPLVPIKAVAYLIRLEMAFTTSAHPPSLAVAGGLCADNLARLLAPVTMLVKTSIDAEGGLRTNDALDAEKVERYLRTAYLFL